MSRSQVVAVFERASTDRSYKALLISNPTEALQNYDLTDDERKTLSTITEENFEVLKGQWIPGG